MLSKGTDQDTHTEHQNARALQRKKFVDTGLLLSHICSKHPRAVLPRLQSSVLDQMLNDKALEADVSLDWITLCLESEQQDMVIIIKERSDMFKWLFCAPSSGVAAKPFPGMREKKCKIGAKLFDSINEKTKTLATYKSSSQFAKALHEIEELWYNVLKGSVLAWTPYTSLEPMSLISSS
ncbi:hypothetical protein ACP70R_007465 [Stipagrostis hirtigluma subsp. patula]